MGTIVAPDATTRTEGDLLLVSISLPSLRKAGELDLQLAPDRLELTAPGYHLVQPLAQRVRDSEATAKFDKKKRVLTVTLPIVSLDDSNAAAAAAEVEAAEAAKAASDAHLLRAEKEEEAAEAAVRAAGERLEAARSALLKAQQAQQAAADRRSAARAKAAEVRSKASSQGRTGTAAASAATGAAAGAFRGVAEDAGGDQAERTEKANATALQAGEGLAAAGGARPLPGWISWRQDLAAVAFIMEVPGIVESSLCVSVQPRQLRVAFRASAGEALRDYVAELALAGEVLTAEVRHHVAELNMMLVLAKREGVMWDRLQPPTDAGG